MNEIRPPTFSIVVPTFRRTDVLDGTLDALLNTDYPADSFEIVVVDDADDSETQRVVVVAADRSEVPVKLLAGANRGAAAARNQGAAVSQNDYLVFVDDDIVVPPHHLCAQLEARAVHGECISGADWWQFTPEVQAELEATPVGRYRLALERGYRKQGADRWSLVSGLATAHFTLRRGLFEQLGGFDERFPHAGVEDWEFCLRAVEHGHKLVLDNHLALLHNDRRLNFDQLCRREEWRGLSVGVLARIRPDDYGDTEVMRENSYVGPADSIGLRARKQIKRVLGTPLALAALHRLAAWLEYRIRPESLLFRFYTAIISVHYLRGFRTGWSRPESRAGTDAAQPGTAAPTMAKGRF